MLKVSRLYNKVFKYKKESKMPKREQKSRRKSDNEDFFTGFPKKKRGVVNSRGIQKITTNKLTVKTKTFTNAVRSVVAVKEESLVFEEEAKALLNEDLFKTIDLSNGNKIEETSNLNSFSGNILSKRENTTNKSIFCEIEEKYQQLSTNFPTNDDNIHKLLSKRLLANKNAILDSFSKIFKNFLNNIRANDLQSLLTARIVSNQSKINEYGVFVYLKLKYPNVSATGGIFRKKFARYCNDLINSQNLGSKFILLSQTTELISRANSNDQTLMDLELKHKFAMSPKRYSQNTEFPPGSYKTPDNQRFDIREFESVGSKLFPAIRTPFPPFVIELNEENCEDSRLMQLHGISERKRAELLAQAKSAKKNPAGPFEAVNVFSRPKKRGLDAQMSPRSPFVDLSPPLPNRKLSFSERFTDSVESDIHLLEDIKNLQMTSNSRMSGVEEKENFQFGSLTPKRNFEFVLQPNSSSDDGGDFDHRAKRFAAAKTELGPIPQLKDTPKFKFQPRLPF